MKKRKRIKIDINKVKISVKSGVGEPYQPEENDKRTWRELIFEALQHYRGTARNAQIYKYIEPKLSSAYLTDSYKRKNFKHIVRGILSIMLKDKQIEWIKRGKYKIIE